MIINVIEKAKVLIEALPYIQRFNNTTFLIKYGGKAMIEENLKTSFVTDVILLKYVGINPVIVHGGGPQINDTLNSMGITPKFINGLRVTDKQTMKIVEMVLGGRINKEIVSLINNNGGKAVGITGKDGNLIKAKKLVQTSSSGKIIDFGMVGEIDKVSPEILQTLEDSNFIPVIAPIASSEENETYNINADRVASGVAGCVKAEKMVMLTDINGVEDEKGNLIHTLTKTRVNELINNGTIKGGMLEKVKACLAALEQGVKTVHIIDGRTPHAVLLEIFTDAGIGTQIISD